MSHSFRQPIGPQPSVPVGQTPLPGRMVAPICTTGSPAVYPMMPNAYGLLSQQSQQYIAQPVVYPQSVPSVQNRIPYVAAVPPNVPRMFVPVAPVPAGINPSVPDPAKLLEEQRRLEKERNFQLQQERLKQFTVAGKKPILNPDNLIDSMFGKLQPKKPSEAFSSHPPPPKANQMPREEKEAKSIPAFEEPRLRSEPCVFNSDVPSTVAGISLPVKKDVKELESMMMECSNLNAPSKAQKFQKPSVKEITASSSHTTTFASSEKARDWRNIQGLDQVFTVPKPRFPSWCAKEKVPDLYKKIQAAVTNNDQHVPDTNLLFPIMVSSGLSRELLGQIWESVNESASGQLSVEEMYAALALIAVAQAGHPVKTVDILHQLPSCPVPQLSCFTSSQEQNSSSPPLAAEESLLPKSSPVPPSEQPVHQVVRPTAITLMNNLQTAADQKDVESVTQNVSEWTPFAGSLSTPDDDFDDFKSATPTAINFSLGTPSSSNIPPAPDEDDFSDFKQAPCLIKAPESSSSIPATTVKFEKMSTKTTKESTIETTPPQQQDLMSPEEDKYSVFRALQEQQQQQSEDTNQWGDFAFASGTPAVFSSGNEMNKDLFTDSKYPSVLVTDSTDSAPAFKTDLATTENNNQDDDEFGDFIHASVTPVPSSTGVTDFADFSNFKQAAESERLPTPQPDDEFGEFTSSVPVSLKPDLGHEFLFSHLKDNISLAESQSVSSLELGTFDGGGGHSGESKSSLSRQGSIPSLDLKGVGLDGTDSEDCFGEIQLSPFVPRNSKSPSPVSQTKGSDENESSSTLAGLVFQASTMPLTDKYSVIRQEKAKEEDQHLSCWIRCLHSAVSILQNTRKMFNQMSCSTICNEVLTSEEGGNYIKNVIEVYKVICRISLASKSLGKQTGEMLDVLNEADQVWNTICGFFAGSPLMPADSSLDFSSGVLRPEPENNAKACGLCLLNIELRSKSFRQEECPKLSYGGRNYHSTCANFWVNCVDPLLPALSLPQLL